MKLKTVLKNLFAWINTLWTRIDKETQRMVPIAITLTNAVKQFVDSPLGEFSMEGLKKLITGSVDDVIIDKAHSFIDNKFPDIIIRLKLIESVVAIEDKNAKALAVLNFLRTADASEKTNFWMGLSAVILEALKDGKITMAEATLIIQSYYHGKIQETA